MSDGEGVVYFCLSSFALVAWNTNLVEDAMKLADDGVDLRRQVASIHGHSRKSRPGGLKAVECDAQVQAVLGNGITKTFEVRRAII